MGQLLELAKIEIPNIEFTDKLLIPIWEKIVSGLRVSEKEGIQLLETEDFSAVGLMAAFAAKQISGNKVFFVLNRHINPTNICVLSCKFCDFAKKPGEKDAYEMSIDDILNQIDENIREVHIVGGHHPTWEFDHYVNMVRSIHDRFPDLQIKAFTASEIDYFHRRWKVTPEESLAILQEAGLQTMPGGGAEVFSDRVHKMLLPGKANENRWLEIHKIAHKMGIKSNCTLLYGHIETFEERIRHLIKLRRLQDETGGFLAFIPLEYQVGSTFLRRRHTPPLDDLKMIAASRIMLDNIKYIKSYWVMLGEATASIGLNFGANDLDGTIGEEKIAHAALADSPIGRAREKMVLSIRDADRIPVERDALYNEIRVYD